MAFSLSVLGHDIVLPRGAKREKGYLRIKAGCNTCS